MILDLERHRSSLELDFCIVGSDPAGITLAIKLAQAGFSVGIIEGGDLEYSERSQSVYQVESTGEELFASSTRLRQFGGTSNHWAGGCRPFERGDFENSPQGGLPGWPIPYDDIHVYLPEAMEILDLPGKYFLPINTALKSGRFDADAFLTSPPTRFSIKYLQEIKRSNQIKLVLNANATDLKFDSKAQRVTDLVASNYRMEKYKVSAKYFVLAAGAIENVRMLLNSMTLAASGVGGPMIGRGFMEHLNVELGTFVLTNSENFQSSQYFVSNEFARSHKVGRGNVSLNILQEIPAGGKLATVKSLLRNISCTLGYEEQIQFLGRFNCPGVGVITTLLEQFPEKEGSRISLGRTVDLFGLRRANIHWSLSGADMSNIRKISLQFAKDFASSGLGIVKLNDFITNSSKKIEILPHAHHMGGTRMARSETVGVVNTDLRFFELKTYMYSAAVSLQLGVEEIQQCRLFSLLYDLPIIFERLISLVDTFCGLI